MEKKSNISLLRFLFFLILVCVLIGIVILIFDTVVNAAEVETETTILSDIADVSADDSSTVFGFYSEPQEEGYMLTKIYNLLLMIFYFYIIDTGRQVIVRNFRKGKNYGGFVE